MVEPAVAKRPKEGNSKTVMIESTMQAAQLGIARLLRHAASNASARIDYWQGDRLCSATHGEIAAQAARLGAALAGRRIGAGSVVATFCSASREHLEAYLGLPSEGAILHTLNIRMADEELAAIVRAIGDVAILVDAALIDRFASLLPKLEGSRLRLLVVAGAADREIEIAPMDGVELVRYEALLAECGPTMPEALRAKADPPEEHAAAICHTGGTTGMPKAVVYSHRSLWLQAMSLCTANSLALSRRDTVLPAVPLYHVNGWGLPFAAIMAGANMVLAGNSFRPDHLDQLIERCQVTLAAGVPTIWTDLLGHRGAAGKSAFASLRRVSTGGAVVPERLIRAFSDIGVEIIQAWGMTETSSMSVIGDVASLPGGGEQRPVGRITCGLELDLLSPEGRRLPHDGEAAGEILIRGPWVTQRYLGSNDRQAFHEGWLRTGDIGTIDSLGWMTLTDRMKDAVKSGGEWIPALALEDALRSLPEILDAAIIARPDPRWQERPLAVIVLREGSDLHPTALTAELAAKVPRWWVPDTWARVEALPRTNLGKPDKARLRALLAEGALAAVTLDTGSNPGRLCPAKEGR